MDASIIKEQINTLNYRLILSLLFIFMGGRVFSFAPQQIEEKPPNIILFMVDDMGWVDTSLAFGEERSPFNDRYHTPHMERLAQEGMMFTRAYATPVCTPTRVSWLTGMNAAHHRVTNWTHPVKDTDSDNYSVDKVLGKTDWKLNGYSPVKGVEGTVHATSVVRLLQKAGYFTMHVGKGHWGPKGTPGADPLQLGFEVNVAGHAGGRPESYLGEANYGNRSGQNPLHAVPHLEKYHGTANFLTEALTLEALDKLEEPIQKGQPFFLHMSHYAVHDPYDADDRFIQKYLDKGLPESEAKYAALLEGMDKSLGDIMGFLQEKGVEEKTVILFMSDNGGLSLSYSRSGTPHTHNAPLNSGKGSVYEGGVRVPMIVKWPGKTKKGTKSEYPVIIEDYFPTLLEIAGVKDPFIIQKVDGKSFVPALKNPDLKNDDRVLVWHLPHKWTREDGPGINYKSALRKGKWKLVYDMKSEAYELFDLSKDLGEQQDLSSRKKAKTKELARVLGKKLKSWEAPMPVRKSSGEKAPYPGK